MYHSPSSDGSIPSLDRHKLPAHDETNGATALPAKSASTRVNAKTAAEALRAASAKQRVKKPRMRKVEAERLQHFKALMKKFGGKGSFAGLDE
jgi:hypothetical protein